MSLKLQKEVIKLNEVLYAEYGETIVENDIIVPVIKPDILKILQVDGDASITQKSIQQDKVVVQGTVRFNVLYTPDTELPGKVKSMSASQMFTHVVDVSGARPNMGLFCEAEVEDIEFSLLNSRKMNIRVKIGVNVKAINSSEVEVAVDILPEDRIQTKGEIIRACNIAYEADKEIIIRDQIEVLSGKPVITEVLKIDAKIIERELRMIENKAVIKGDIDICTLFSATEFIRENNEEFDKEVESIHFMEHQLQFNEILDLPGINESMEGEVDFYIKEIYFDVVEDMNGDRRIVNIEITVSAVIKATDIVEINAIEDAYAIDCEVDIKKGMYNIEQLIGKASQQISHRDLAVIPPHMPEINQIFNCKAVPVVTGMRVEDSKVFVEGAVETHILYMSKDMSSPISFIKHKSEFMQGIEISGMEEKVMCESKLNVAHLSYNITMDREIELRFVLDLSVKAVKATQTELIEEINLMENAKIDPRPSIVIYFVQSGDTLWSIAKHYKTTPALIMKNNNLESDMLSIGQQLMI